MDSHKNITLPLWPLLCLMCFVALFSSAVSYSYEALLFLLPITVILLVTCLVRFFSQSSRRNTGYLLVAIIMLVIWGYFFKRGDQFADDVRWLIWSENYKRNVISRVASPADVSDPNPKHILWRAWGELGMDSEADLVYDTSGTLSQIAAENSHNEKIVYGCPVADVHQLESNWYIITLYTNEGWPDC